MIGSFQKYFAFMQEYPQRIIKMKNIQQVMSKNQQATKDEYGIFR